MRDNGWAGNERIVRLAQLRGKRRALFAGRGLGSAPYAVHKTAVADAPVAEKAVADAAIANPNP